jgi:hypothetical protein
MTPNRLRREWVTPPSSEPDSHAVISPAITADLSDLSTGNQTDRTKGYNLLFQFTYRSCLSLLRHLCFLSPNCR